MKDWDYAEFTKTASEHGGPKKFLTEFGDEKFNEGKMVGEEIGEKRGEIKGFIGGGLFSIVIYGGAVGIMKWRKSKAKKNAEKVGESRKKSSLAAKNYIDAVKETDVNDNDYVFDVESEEDYEDDE